MFPVFILLLIGVSSASSEEINQAISGAKDAAQKIYDNCDVDTYYKDHRDGEWGWNRDEIASLLIETHRQVVASDAVSEFFSGALSVNTTKMARQYATNTDTRGAIAELDYGTAIVRENDNNVTIKTVHMIFTKTDIPVSDGISTGWEPGYLWPMDDLKNSLSYADAKENELDYQDEVIAAIHDLHNIRPRHPIVHHGQHTNKWFYNSCQECKLDQNDITVEQNDNSVQERTEIGMPSTSRPQWGEENFSEEELRLDAANTLDDDEGTDHLCVCTQEHALQPPKMARGEVARALLYMNLRYGKPLDEALSTLSSPHLDLMLTDCHPLIDGGEYDDDVATYEPSTNTIGYFSRLVEWHLADPPNQREIDRNNAICQYYQGNRNPFVDFYEESWALLDFESIEREVCPGAASEWDDDGFGVAEFESENEIKEDEESEVEGHEADVFGCRDLMPGDVSFFMVKPSLEKQGTINLKQAENWNRKSFGLVSLVDLKPGLDIYVVGVDDEDPNKSYEDHDGGTLKLEVPDQGIPAGSFFGYGNHMYLGTQWQPLLKEGEQKHFSFSVHQLYLYCIESAKDEMEAQSGVEEEFKILAALSTTGKSFGNEGLPPYWENFLASHPDVKLSEHFTDGIHYGLIVLPKDASDSEISGGYRYDGPTYTKHDPYAKALIDEAYWERINNLDSDINLDGGEGGIYYKSSEEDQATTNDAEGAVIEVQPRLDGGAMDSGSKSSLCSLTVFYTAFVAWILPCAIFS